MFPIVIYFRGHNWKGVTIDGLVQCLCTCILYISNAIDCVITRLAQFQLEPIEGSTVRVKKLNSEGKIEWNVFQLLYIVEGATEKVSQWMV